MATNLQLRTRAANVALLSIGQKTIVTLTETTVDANRVNLVFDELIEQLLGDDWTFNRERVLIQNLTQIVKLTVDSAPTPTATGWAVGDTLTGQTSGVTCVVKKVVSTTEYWVTKPASDFTDGETLASGADSVNCSTGYPAIDESPLDNWDYIYLLPTNLVNLRFVTHEYEDQVRYEFDVEGDFLYTDITDGVLAYNKKLEETTDVYDLTKMPVWFRRLISASLAYNLAPNVTENMRYRQKAEIEINNAYLFAKEQNGQNTFNIHEQGHNDWVDGADTLLLGY